MVRYPLFQAALAIVGVASVSSAPPPLSFTIPRSATSFPLGGQPIAIAVTGGLSGVSRDAGHTLFKLELTADLSDLQTNLTPVLRSQLDRSDPCGDRIAVQHAAMSPAAPASLVAVDVHVERWTCSKVLGKQVTKKLIGGTGSIQLKLTPEIRDHAAIHMSVSVEAVNAEGLLGELLRTGPVGAMVRNKVDAMIGEALQNGNRLTAALPPVAQPFARLDSVAFRDAGDGRLAVVLDGDLQISDSQIAGLASQLTPR